MDRIFIHPTAVVETGTIGDDTRIWAFTHVLSGAVLGARCNASDHCYIEGGVRIEARGREFGNSDLMAEHRHADDKGADDIAVGGGVGDFNGDPGAGWEILKSKRYASTVVVLARRAESGRTDPATEGPST